MNQSSDGPDNVSRRRLLACVAACVATFVPGASLAEQGDSLLDVGTAPQALLNPAEDFITTIAGDLINVANADVTDDEKKSQFQYLLETYADIPTIAEFSLGQYAADLSDELREHYYALVAGYISRIFVIHSVNLGGRDVEVLGSSVRDERETLVDSKVWFDSGRALPVVWRVISTDVGLKVFDVSVNGIWLAIQQRTEFVSVIREGNGDVNALLAYLVRNN